MMDQEKEGIEQSDAVRKDFEAQFNAASAPRTSIDAGPSFVPRGRSFPLNINDLPDDPLMPDLENTAEEPTKIAQALDDESWVEAMQEELLQFKIQKIDIKSFLSFVLLKMERNIALTKDKDGEDVDVHLYRSMIGSLMYLTSSRPDIIDYAGANLDRKSTTGGCQFLGSRLISWQCKKQTVVANLTTEAEYIAASYYCGQVLWIQN
ncbi:hypothetical protein Tco_1160421 [Tanacetum coccineum]